MNIIIGKASLAYTVELYIMIIIMRKSYDQWISFKERRLLNYYYNIYAATLKLETTKVVTEEAARSTLF